MQKDVIYKKFEPKTKKATTSKSDYIEKNSLKNRICSNADYDPFIPFYYTEVKRSF